MKKKANTEVISPYTCFTLASKNDIANVIRHDTHLVPENPHEIGMIPEMIADTLLQHFIIYKKER